LSHLPTFTCCLCFSYELKLYMVNIMDKIKISKTAVKILIVSLSAALGAFAFAVFAYLKDVPSYDLIIKIGLRIMVIGAISAATYDLVNKTKN